MVKTVLIVGGSGFLGTSLALKLREGYKVFTTYDSHPIRIRGVTSIPMRLGNRSAGKQIVSLTRPEVIIFAAGSNDADLAERYVKECETVHTTGAGGVALASQVQSSKMIFLSNAQVFDGRKGNYHEQDVVLPSSMLGKCKLGGENFVRGKAVNYLVLRLSPILGPGNGTRMTLFDRLRIALGRKQRIVLPNDELYNFAPVSQFTDMLIGLIESGPRNKVLHYGGLTKLTHFQLGVEFAKRFGFDPALVVPGQTARKTVSRIDDADHRFRDYSLNSTQLVEMLKIKPLLLQESFDLIEQDLVAKL